MSNLENAFNTLNFHFKNGCKIHKSYVPCQYTVPFKPMKKCDGCEGVQIKHTKMLFTASGTQSIPNFNEIRPCFVQGYVRRPYEDL